MLVTFEAKTGAIMKCFVLTFVLIAVMLSTGSRAFAGQAKDDGLAIVASFSAQHAVRPDERIELLLSRDLRGMERRLAVFIAATDVSHLFTAERLRLRYDSRFWPLPIGESIVTVYLVSQGDRWDELAHFTLRVAERDANLRDEGEKSDSNSELAGRILKTHYQGLFDSSAGSKQARGLDVALLTGASAPSQSTPAGQPAQSHKDTTKFTPSVTLTVTSQPAQSTFPGPQPERATFTQIDLQASLKNDSQYGIFTTQSSFDFAGSSFQQSALRFGTLGKEAPQIDLSSYLIHFQTGKVKYDVGHFAFGTQRQLINGFSSRGLQISVPFLKQFDFTVATMNGTQLVGYDNFFGIAKAKHRMLAATLGIELNRKRPGGLRVEVSGLNAYFQPISGVNRGVVTDLQRSNGVAVRLIMNDKAQRFHFEGGFTRSFFSSPSDPTLNQGAKVVALPNLTRNAHYLDVSYQVLKDHALSKTKKASLTVAFQEENVAPLFRSLGASTQADKIQYAFSVNGSINEIVAQFVQTNFHDNLRQIPSILRTLNGLTHVSIAAPASALLNRPKSSPWLPRLAYSYDRAHSFGAAIPVNGGFEFAPNSIPDLIGTNQVVSADWQVKKFTWGYNFNRSFQDNRQPTRERADRAVLVNTGRVGWVINSHVNLNFDLSGESADNKETGRIDRTYRVGPAINWQLTKQMALSMNLANTIAGDAANTSHSRNTEFDAAWTYRFARGKEQMKKVSGQFFIRYANHYSHALERLLPSDSLRKVQTLTASLGITFF